MFKTSRDSTQYDFSHNSRCQEIEIPTSELTALHALDATETSLLKYLEKGLSVIPLRPREKAPAANWTVYQSTLPTQEDIKSWCARSPDLNIGIVTGEVSGIVVLDVDGPEALEHIRSHHELPVTPTATTGKGTHYYFKHPGIQIPNRTGVLRQVDIRGDGGYVVAPPSIHANGKRYEWQISPFDVPYAPLPDWVQELALKGTATLDSDTKANTQISRGTRQDIDRILGELTQAEEGERNDRLNNASFELGQYVGSHALDRKTAIRLLAGVAKSIGLQQSEIYSTIMSGLKAGISKPRKPVGEVYDILDEVPESIDRPIRLIAEHAYGVTWLPLRSSGSDDQTITKPVVFRDDGTFYAEVDIPNSNRIDDLGLQVDLEFEVPASKRLSPRGFKRFISGQLATPADVFHRVTRSIDTFVSFDASSNEQLSMCELVACWTIGTYFGEAFDVYGYLWPNGERGSGKTQLLNAISTLAFLGKTVTSGSSFASIRDEAHYGATIAFDDCENVRDMDTNKRELLLAGNTRGTVITHKEPVGDGWRNKSINSFAPRLFSAINLPDPVLDSRTIRLPMVASADKHKTRKSPSRQADWPHDVSILVDDLWMMAVKHLMRVRACDQEASQISPLVGRSHDIFRMPLAIAYWLQTDHAFDGLFDRISSIADDHQGMKLDAGGHDLVSLTLMAINQILSDTGNATAYFPTKKIAEVLREVALLEEATDFLDINPQRIGLMLGNLGFKPSRSHGRARSWLLNPENLLKIAKSRSIKLPKLEPRSSKEALPPIE